jgi:hypothetical protein
VLILQVIISLKVIRVITIVKAWDILNRFYFENDIKIDDTRNYIGAKMKVVADALHLHY